MRLHDYKLKDWTHKIRKEIDLGDFKILLLDIDLTVMPPKNGRKNLVAIDKEENIKWIANLPEGYPLYGSFDNISFENKQLKALCGSTLCVVDFNTGLILSETFTR